MTADSIMHAHDELAPAPSATFDDMDFGGYSVDDDFARFTTVNDQGSSATLADTVSPHDLSFSHDTFLQAPNSGTSTFLTTPSLLDDASPYLTDSLDVSPIFETGDFSDDAFFHYAPAKTTQSRTEVADSTEASLARGLSVSRNAPARAGNDVDEGRRRDLLRQRLSLTAGIAKSSRRQTKELEPIVVDTGDERAAKRAKNTMAARKSRQKKKDEVSQLEAQIRELMDDRDYWKMTAIQHGAPIPASPSAASPGT